MKEYGFNTTLLHGTEGNNPHGATQVPIYQSSAFRHDTAEELEKIFSFVLVLLYTYKHTMSIGNVCFFPFFL